MTSRFKWDDISINEVEELAKRFKKMQGEGEGIISFAFHVIYKREEDSQ